MGHTLELKGFPIGSSGHISSPEYPRFGLEHQTHLLAAPVHADHAGTCASKGPQVLFHPRGIVRRMSRRAGVAGETPLPDRPQPHGMAGVMLATTKVMSSSNPPVSGPRSHQLDR